MLAGSRKRILRNTGMLYMRMLLAMGVGLYTSRVVLDVLGVVDFGVYHVVAGFVALLGFMQGAMTTATQRYFSFDLGESGGSNLSSLYSTSLQIHAVLAILVAFLAETVGFWFVSTQLNIPSDRMAAAFVAYHLSVGAFCVSVMTVPLTAMLMAQERMGLFALMSMADVLLKLIVVVLLSYTAYDKLSAYAALLLMVSIATFTGYLLINKAVFPLVRFEWRLNVDRFLNMFGFTIWNSWGYLAAAMTQHGNNILLNIFFGPIVNASRGVATQANGALTSFVANIQAAINPQIVKLYAGGNVNEMCQLIYSSSKYNYLVLVVLATPVFVFTNQLLQIWLVQPPPYAALFLKLVVVASIIDSLSQSMITAVQATGKIRCYQLLVGSVFMLNLPFSYLVIKIWDEPELVLWVGIVIQSVVLAVRLFMVRLLIGMNVRAYIKSVLVRALLVGFLVIYIVPQIGIDGDNLVSLMLGVFASIVSSLLICFFVGLSSSERNYLIRLASRLVRTAVGAG